MALELLRPIAATVLVAMAAFGAGTWIPALLPNSFSRVSRLVYSWLGGFGALGIALFVVGQWSFGRATIGGILAAGVVLAVFRFIREPAAGPQSVVPAGARGKIPVAIVGAVLAIAAISGLADPIGDVGTDGVSYHYAGAKVWLRNDIVRPLPDNAPTAYPATVEMVFAALMEFGGSRAPSFSAAFTFALFLGVCMVTARRCGLDAADTWWAAALIAAMPAVYRGAHSGFVDAVFAAVVLAAARIGIDAEERRHFAALGFFGGLAIAIKYPGMLALPPLLLVALWPRARGESNGLAGNALVAIVTAAVVAAPMYVKNWILLGSPVYPPPVAAAQFLQVKYLSPGGIAEFYAYNARRGAGHGAGLWSLLTLPFNLTYHTADFNGGGGIGLAPLALGPIGLVAAWPNRFVRRLACLAALLTLTWFVTMQEARFLIHVYAIAAILGVAGWRYAAQLIPTRGRILCVTAVAISVAYGVGVIARTRLADMHAAFSPAYSADRRIKEIPYIESLDALNRDGSVTTVLLFDPMIAGFYSDHNYVKPFGTYGERALGESITANGVLCRLQGLGISHILDVESEVSGFRVPPDHPGLELVFERPHQRVYRVVSAAAVAAGISECSSAPAR